MKFYNLNGETISKTFKPPSPFKSTSKLYSPDKTLKPQAQLPQLVEVDALTSIYRVGITSVGSNYLSSPGLVVLDGLTNKIVRDIDLDYELGDDEQLFDFICIVAMFEVSYISKIY